MPGLDRVYIFSLMYWFRKFFLEEKLKFNFKMLQYRAIVLFLMVLNGSIQGRIPWWNSPLIVAFSLNCEYAISFFLTERKTLYIWLHMHIFWTISIYKHSKNENSTKTCSNFCCHLWINFPAKNLLSQQVRNSRQGYFQMSYFNVRNCLPSCLLRSLIFFKFYCYIILIRLCTSVLTAFLSCLQIRWSCANLASVTSSWLVHRPLC